MVPSAIQFNGWQNIVFLRDASLGLCQCEKDDWRFIENELWSFVMSPYEQLFVDVKFSRGTAGFVSVYLHEATQVWRYVLLVVGIALLFSASKVSKHMLSRDTDDGVDLYLIKWIVRVIAVTCIFQSSIDTISKEELRDYADGTLTGSKCYNRIKMQRWLW